MYFYAGRVVLPGNAIVGGSGSFFYIFARIFYGLIFWIQKIFTSGRSQIGGAGHRRRARGLVRGDPFAFFVLMVLDVFIDSPSK